MGAVLHNVYDGPDRRRVSQALRWVQADCDGGAQLAELHLRRLRAHDSFPSTTPILLSVLVVIGLPLVLHAAQADASWNCFPPGPTGYCYSGTSACFLFGLGPREEPQRFGRTGTDAGYQFASRYLWPSWGYHVRGIKLPPLAPRPAPRALHLVRINLVAPAVSQGAREFIYLVSQDLYMGSTGPPGANGYCDMGATFNGRPNQVCGGGWVSPGKCSGLGCWGETQLEVWRLA